MPKLSQVMSAEAKRQFWAWCNLTYPYFETSGYPMPRCRGALFTAWCVCLWLLEWFSCA